MNMQTQLLLRAGLAAVMTLVAVKLNARGLEVQDAAQITALVSRQSVFKSTPIANPTSPGGRYGYAIRDGLLVVYDGTSLGIVARIPLDESVTGPVVVHPKGTTVYVPTQSSILEIDTRSRTVVRSLPMGGATQMLISSDGLRLYVAGEIGGPRSSAMADIDVQAFSVRASLALPLAPGSLALLPDNSKLYVPLPQTRTTAGSVYVYDTRQLQFVRQIPVLVTGMLAPDPSGRFIYAATRDGVPVISTLTDTVISTIALPQVPNPPGSIPVATAIAFSPDGSLAYVAAYRTGLYFGASAGWVVVMDTRTHQSLGVIDLQQFGGALVVDPDGSRVYVSGNVLGDSARPNSLPPAGVAVIDTATRTVVATLPPQSNLIYTVGLHSLSLNPLNGKLYALDALTMSEIDTGSYSISATMPVRQYDIAALAPLFAPDPPAAPGAPWHFALLSRNNTYLIEPWGSFGDLSVAGDYDGDARADLAVLRPLEGSDEAVWYVKRSSDGGVVRQQWGARSLGDIPVPADYDGDGRADIAVWRVPIGEWEIRGSATGAITSVRFGTHADIPVPADYDGDRRADLASYRAGTWEIYGSVVGNTQRRLGSGLDLPVPGDYDGDGRADAAVFGPMTGAWTILQSASGAQRTVSWGAAGDIPVPADYDGDRVTDIAIWRPGTGAWWVISSRSGAVLSTTWGAAGDQPEPFDFDGDGKADLGVHRR